MTCELGAWLSLLTHIIKIPGPAISNLVLVAMVYTWKAAYTL
jgi:hypothetical protein